MMKPMITAQGLTKRYGTKTVVDQLSFTVPSGQVTGFLGPNGAGKSTTMRMLVGLDIPTSGTSTLNGKPFSALASPMREVGVLLDAGYLHPTRTAHNHLWALAVSNGIPKSRVGEVLGMVGLADAAGKRVGQFSLGMKQRLGLAAALLGDPGIIILDEPANGLDPEGVHWIRNFLAALAKEGRTVFASSHLLSEMALLAERLVIIGQGELIAETTVAELTRADERSIVIVRSPRAADLATLLEGAGVDVGFDGTEVRVTAWTSDEVGRFAFQHHIEVHELRTDSPSLEEAFLSLTAGSQEYRTQLTATGVPS
jgi:ABC-2 type transport system ATP-binding protein